MQRPTKALGIDIPATLLGPRRRGDRIILPFAKVHESVAGTKRTCRCSRRMSAVEGMDGPR
jgi:hypothetical protein